MILYFNIYSIPCCAFPGSPVSKESAWRAGDLGLIPGSGRPSGEGNGYPLQYSCLENPMDRGDWQTKVDGVTTIGRNLATTPPYFVEEETEAGRS